MRIGYPCVNRTIGCRSDTTFRLKSYSKKRLEETVAGNLSRLFRILKFNLSHNRLFFRISSNLVPLASHPIFKFNWQEVLKDKFRQIGTFVKSCGMRVSMHPDQFILINSPHLPILRRSVKGLRYHCQILDLMGL